MPYVPNKHERYDLLPWSRANGGECFSYPSELDELDEEIRRALGSDVSEERSLVSFVYPYGCDSCEDCGWSVLQKAKTA